MPHEYHWAPHTKLAYGPAHKEEHWVWQVIYVLPNIFLIVVIFLERVIQFLKKIHIGDKESRTNWSHQVVSIHDLVQSPSWDAKHVESTKVAQSQAGVHPDSLLVEFLEGHFRSAHQIHKITHLDIFVLSEFVNRFQEFIRKFLLAEPLFLEFYLFFGDMRISAASRHLIDARSSFEVIPSC